MVMTLMEKIWDFIYFASFLNLNKEYATKVINIRNNFQ